MRLMGSSCRRGDEMTCLGTYSLFCLQEGSIPLAGRMGCLLGREFERTNWRQHSESLGFVAELHSGVAVEGLFLSGLTKTCSPLTTPLQPRLGGSRPSQLISYHCIRDQSMGVVLGWGRDLSFLLLQSLKSPMNPVRECWLPLISQ